MQKVVIIGSGNVASHLAKRLDEVAHVCQIYSQNLDHAQAVAERMRDCQAIDDLNLIDTDADIYLISVTDSALPQIASALPDVRGIVAHTSGSVGISALKHKKSGVLYPLQTFSKGAELDMKRVPFFIEASDTETEQKLWNLAQMIAPETTPQIANSQQRKRLHIAAVFACNFANHLWAIADQLLSNDGYPLDVLYPLMEVTLKKAETMPPAKAQTGPAARGDQGIINQHLAMLESRPDLQEIYLTLTKHIQKK